MKKEELLSILSCCESECGGTTQCRLAFGWSTIVHIGPCFGPLEKIVKRIQGTYNFVPKHFRITPRAH